MHHGVAWHFFPHLGHHAKINQYYLSLNLAISSCSSSSSEVDSSSTSSFNSQLNSTSSSLTSENFLYLGTNCSFTTSGAKSNFGGAGAQYNLKKNTRFSHESVHRLYFKRHLAKSCSTHRHEIQTDCNLRQKLKFKIEINDLLLT